MELGPEFGSDEYFALAEFRALAAELIRLDEEFHQSADLAHPDDIGAEREGAFLELLQARFGQYALLQRAGIEDLDGKSCNQHDVVIADQRVSPRRQLRSGRFLIGPRGVHAAIEVKSTLSSRYLLESLDKLAGLKGVARCAADGEYVVTIGDQCLPYVPISGGVFAYRSELSLSTIAEKIQAWTKDVPHVQWPNFVAVLDRGHIGWVDPASGEVRTTPHGGDIPLRYERDDPCDPLVGLMKALEGLSRWWHAPGTPRSLLPRPLVPVTAHMKGGIAIRPAGVPGSGNPHSCADHLCVNCHYYGRMSFEEQRRRRSAKT